MSDDEEELVDLPDFANAANRALYADLKDAERALAATEEELAETGERVSVMEGHLGSVVAERQNTQRLVDAKAKEVETEDHLKQLADRELGRFSSELSKLQREWWQEAAVAERQAELEAEVTKTSVQQVELDRTADDYRALQRERRGLLLQSRSGATASPHPSPPPPRPAAAAERDRRRAQIRGAEESLEERRAALEAAKAKLAAAEEAASRSSDNLGSLEAPRAFLDPPSPCPDPPSPCPAASRQMDELHAREGARLKERAKAAGALREALYAETARLQAARQEVLYTADFQLQLMQRKVARATGVRSAEEQTELKSQIATLQRQLEQQGATARMLSEQEKRLSNELKRARRREEEVTTEEARLRAAIDAVEVDNTLAQKQIKKEAQQRQEATVAADLLRLEVKKLREALHGRTDGVFGLENRKSQLQLSMAERQEEIKVHTDVLRAQLKAAEDERSRAKKARAAGRRLGSISAGSRAPSRTGPPPSQALTERLLRVDRLSAKSANLEGKPGAIDARLSTPALAHTAASRLAPPCALRHLVDKNAAYKAALAPAGPRTPLAEQRALLEEQHRAALARCRAHKVQQSEVEEEIGQMGVTLDELADVSGAQRQHYERLADASRSIGATLQERRGELQRVASELSSLLDAHRESAAASGVQGATALEREAALSERLVANRTTLERLAALSAEDASFGPALESLCAQAGVPPPDALPGDE
ncbi:hypothetical protein EMIHUDRAFT_462178 [Emiliania huxleyi CCMP1516]|uniref:Uncharacterized protein n=2 Tax=Emiliania huxleyi TaxID=2903 RepID=A0A0D3KUY6_EMIH1|nr:hypothetical protein EMIHUDRAFT_462178 [Emiliania huxleyi CCMP1516]EOD39571.1 hypothetical protein EMIHUDRAFT_462178 [Emiliania huxleyi CCMP1516]|eukprot:XP_005792000.1 hypothetical protein EMIHUDRAFT_462178 [Emiliania huxleyi CCMP1516]